MSRARRQDGEDDGEEKDDAFDDAASYGSAEDEDGKLKEEKTAEGEALMPKAEEKENVEVRFGEVEEVAAENCATGEEQEQQQEQEQEQDNGEDSMRRAPTEEFFIGEDKGAASHPTTSAEAPASEEAEDCSEDSPKQKKEKEPEDKNTKVPRDIRYFLHDDRGEETAEVDGAADPAGEAGKGGKAGKSRGGKDSDEPEKGTADSDGPWGHDMYNELYGDGAKAKAAAPKQRRWKEEDFAGGRNTNGGAAARRDAWNGGKDEAWSKSEASKDKAWRGSNDGAWSKSEASKDKAWGGSDDRWTKTNNADWSGAGGGDKSSSKRNGNAGDSWSKSDAWKSTGNDGWGAGRDDDQRRGGRRDEDWTRDAGGARSSGRRGGAGTSRGDDHDDRWQPSLGSTKTRGDHSDYRQDERPQQRPPGFAKADESSWRGDDNWKDGSSGDRWQADRADRREVHSAKPVTRYSQMSFDR